MDTTNRMKESKVAQAGERSETAQLLIKALITIET